MPATRTIIHADMDAFYAAVEQQDRPELRGQPVIVGATSARGVVLTASYEARRFGVHSAMPAVRARQLCPGGLFIAPRMRRYAEVGRQVRGIFREFTPVVEPLSLDEAFLDVSASLALFGSASQVGEQLKARVRAVTGLAVSVGIAPNKLIAKIASAACKPDGLLHVRPQDVRAFLRPLPVDRLWGAGPVVQAHLRRLGIGTVGQLADADPQILQRRLGTAGPALWHQAHGRDDRAVDPERQRKSYGEECTFERDVRDPQVVRRAIMAHAEAIARRLRNDHCRARAAVLKLKLTRRIAPGKYPIVTRRLTLAEPSDDGLVLARAALVLWERMPLGTSVRLVGVSASDIARAADQLPLFDGDRPRRRAALNAALDTIARRFGDRAVVPAELAGAHGARRPRN